MTRPPAPSPAIAFGVAAVGIAVYSCMDAIMKRLSIESGAYSAVLWRSVVGVALLGRCSSRGGGRGRGGRRCGCMSPAR